MTLTGLTIPFNGLKKQYNNLRSEILDVTDEVLRSGQLMNGNYTAEFENWLAKRNHTRYAVTCHSGTQALEIIARFYCQDIFDHQPTVVIPAMTYPATVNAFIQHNYFKIRIVDVDNAGLLNVNDLRVKHDDLVVLVGLYGAAVSDLSKNITTLIIEDAAQHWLADHCQRVGHAAAISFDPTKNLPNYGNGGAVVTDDPELVDYARTWRSHGKPNHESWGSNSRMSEIDCAQMMVKTRHLDSWQTRRKTIAAHWIEIFTRAGIRCLINEQNFKTHAFQKFVIDIDNRNTIQEKLIVRKIDAKIHYEKSLFELPMLRSHYNSQQNYFLSNAASLSRRVLSLPFYPELSDLEVEYIAEQVVKIYNKG